MEQIQKPFSNVQLELLKIYSTGVPDQTLIDLKKLIAGFFMEKARKEADKIWQEKNYSVEEIESLVYDNQP